jgi:hypothetical protein
VALVPLTRSGPVGVNPADIRDQAEKAIAAAGLVVAHARRTE